MHSLNLDAQLSLLYSFPDTRSLFVITVALVLSYMNYRGLTVVGNSLVVSAIVVVVPFVLLVSLSIPQIQPENWGVYERKEVDWGTFINVMFWWVLCCMLDCCVCAALLLSCTRR